MSNCDAAVRIVRIDRKFKVLLREDYGSVRLSVNGVFNECERRYMITERLIARGALKKRKGCRLYR